MKECYAEIQNGNMVMPAEVLDILPQGCKLYMCTDSERGTVTIFTKDPSDLPNKWFFKALDEFAEGQSWDEYSKPIAAEDLRRKRTDEEGGK